ncbi:MAG TPA: YaiO family outer membrane beta-barrel protein [Verrucomicrobiae bacterium]|jgi:YaiO family outer membrane protein|nr:YaiO family outer membrane beta-barrel protein [Verrucomicrobiae bacterium]
MKKTSPLLFICLLLCGLMSAQSTNDTTVAPGSSLPGMGGLALGLNGPGYIEVGGSHSNLSGGYSNWNDQYLRGVLSGGKNTFNYEFTHEARFGDSGYFGTLGLTRTFSSNWYGEFSAGASVGGFFLNRYSVGAILNRKLLKEKELVVNGGFGFDQSKTVNYDERFQAGAAYYFHIPVVLQGGFLWTHTSPGNIFARTQYIAINEGYNKEHYFSLRYEYGREGYEVIGPPVDSSPSYNVVFDFPEHTITGTWRQWIGPNWGVNLNIEQHQETSYHRWGGTLGVFLDF